MARPYFVAVSYNLDCRAGVQFGDYDRETVRFEISELRRADRIAGLKPGDVEYRLVRCADARKSTIDAAVAAIQWD